MSDATSAIALGQSSAYGAPRCYIDVYPYEGGSFTVTNEQIGFTSLTVGKSIGGGGKGTFQLDLAPGGPFGLNARPTWMEIFTPFSIVVIGMQRANHAGVVMIGLVGSTNEEMIRDQNGVRRVIRIMGEDFTKMFTTFCYYNLDLLIGLGPGSLGQTGLGLISGIAGALQGTPAHVASSWYNQIMAGPGGLMASTTFAYQGGRVSFYDLMATWFEEYPANIDIPMMTPFIGEQGSWLDKFTSFCPYPWYEFFIQTAPVGYYSAATKAKTPIVQSRYAPASPTLVCRVNPFPFLNSAPPAGAPTFSVDQTRWNALPNFGMDGGRGPIGQSFGYSDAEVKNFYIFMPTWLATSFGASNGSISPFQLQFSAWADIASIHRYGYRPQVSEVRWMADQGFYAQALAAQGKGAPDVQQLVSDLSLRPVAYAEPTPNMLRGACTMELRPDILAGNTFTYAPYRDAVAWTFYIDAVSHAIPFGSRPTTTLSLSRGLTAADYADSGIMTALLTGNAQRLDGVITIGLPPGIGTPLNVFNSSTAQSALQQISPLFGGPRPGPGPSGTETADGHGSGP